MSQHKGEIAAFKSAQFTVCLTFRFVERESASTGVAAVKEIQAEARTIRRKEK